MHRRSVIDLGGAGLTVLTDPLGTIWEAAATEVAARAGTPLVVEVSASADVRDAFDLAGSEAILIRPDGHIAWRSGAAPEDAPAALRTLAAAVRMATGWAGEPEA